jgi:hypothetical protein
MDTPNTVAQDLTTGASDATQVATTATGVATAATETAHVATVIATGLTEAATVAATIPTTIIEQIKLLVAHAELLESPEYTKYIGSIDKVIAVFADQLPSGATIGSSLSGTEALRAQLSRDWLLAKAVMTAPASGVIADIENVFADAHLLPAGAMEAFHKAMSNALAQVQSHL